MTMRALWRTARRTRAMGALPELARPLVGLPDTDALRLSLAPKTTVADGVTSWAGIEFGSQVRSTCEVPWWRDHPVLDQLGANSCVANAMMRAEVSTLTGRHALPVGSVPLGSRLFAYYWARYKVGMQSLDDGSFPSVAMEQIAARGVPVESAWPYRMLALNTKPGAQSRWDSSERRGIRGSFMVYDVGQHRIDRIRAVHASGRSMTMTLPVYGHLAAAKSALLRWTDRGEYLLGYHHVELGGTLYADGQWWGLCCNSWGADAHADGFFAIDEQYLLEQASSLCVLDPEEPAR